MSTPEPSGLTPYRPRRRLPRSFRDLTPSQHFQPASFFHQMVWKALMTRRTGTTKEPKFPQLQPG